MWMGGEGSKAFAGWEVEGLRAVRLLRSERWKVECGWAVRLERGGRFKVDGRGGQ